MKEYEGVMKKYEENMKKHEEIMKEYEENMKKYEGIWRKYQEPAFLDPFSLNQSGASIVLESFLWTN